MSILPLYIPQICGYTFLIGEKGVVMVDTAALVHMEPSLPMLAGAFPQGELRCGDPERYFRDLRLYRRDSPLDPGVLYLVSREDAEDFPPGYAGICQAPLKGDCLVVPDQALSQIFNTAMTVYDRCREQEGRLDQLVFQGCSLKELCEEAAALLDNPVYVHDDWFMLLAQSSQEEAYPVASQRPYLPKKLIDDPQFDSDYLETYSTHHVQLWKSAQGWDSLYVNLWDGATYRGRVLVFCCNHPFTQWDYRLTEGMAQRMLLCMRGRSVGNPQVFRSMDDVMMELLDGRQPDSGQLLRLMEQLEWLEEDPFVCLDIRPQQDSIAPIAERKLYSDLFRYFPGSYVLLRDHRQIVVLNMRTLSIPYNLLRQTLAPLCQDRCLYAGISAPVSGIRELHYAAVQADIAVGAAFAQRGQKWIRLFSHNALAHMVESIRSPLPTQKLLSPALLALREYDQIHGTAYFETLRMYLICERDIPRTSQALIIHRTTLLYRLKKIESLVSLNLEDPDQRLYLRLSLWILDRQQKKEPEKEILDHG